MRVELITEMDGFSRLREDWDRVYCADPHAQLFLSWIWLCGWLPKLRDPWIILAVREDKPGPGRFVAFWPIRIETRIDAKGVLCNDVKMAGNHVADYTGFICRPEIENQAIAAFGRKLAEMNWSVLHLDNFAGPEYRVRQLLVRFSRSRFTSEVVGRVNKSDGIDNNVCPYAELPASFDEFLASLSANTRQKLRRLLRLVDEQDRYRITIASTETVSSDLDILLNFWRKKWVRTKGNATEGLVRTNRAMLLRSFELGLLYLPVIWQGDRALVALATLVDEAKGAYHFYMTGRDEEFDGPPLGMLLHAYSIRQAISAGFRRYDFLRGNEAYKYSFASKEDRIRYLKLQTKTARNVGEKLDPRTLDAGLQLATELHQGGRLAEAERGYRQILGTCPDYADALYRLGQLLSTKGSYSEARRVFMRLTRVRPDAAKAWHYLAQACEMLGDVREAERAYRKVSTIEPDFPEIGRKIERVEALARGASGEVGHGASFAGASQMA